MTIVQNFGKIRHLVQVLSGGKATDTTHYNAISLSSIEKEAHWK
jgi:hypothetical protein